MTASLNEGLAYTFAGMRRSRKSLRRLVNSLTPEQYSLKHDWCGAESVMGSLTHIVDCELLWVQGVILQTKSFEFVRDGGHPLGFTAMPTTPGALYAPAYGLADDMEKLFAFQDVVSDATARLINEIDLWTPREYTFPWEPEARETFRPWYILNHVITHEFHHKGQIVGMCRAMGITEIPETDLA
jgi:uncharacterized damage-inducible protein DinB